MTQHIKDLREKRKKLVTEAQEILALGDKMTKEDEARFDTMIAESDKLKEQIDRHERADSAARELEAAADLGGILPDTRGGQSGEQRTDAAKQYDAVWRKYAAGGLDALEPNERQVLRNRYQPVSGFIDTAENRAQTVTTTGGGYLIPQGFQPELEKALKDFGGIYNLARVIRTSTGNPLPWPNTNDTGNKAVLTTINTQTTETNVVFGQKQLDAYTFRSLILVPIELMQDSAFNLDVEFPAMLGERIARGTADYYATGTGSSQPQGVVGAAAAGYTAASSSAIAYDDLVELEHSIDPAYRRSPKAGWAMADSTLKSIKKLKDSNGNPLWTPGLAANSPDTILGYRYAIDQTLPIMGSSNKSILFGDWSKFIIREVNQMLMLRLTERYADYGQVGMFVFSRTDSELMDAGTNPIKYLLHPSP